MKNKHSEFGKMLVETMGLVKGLPEGRVKRGLWVALERVFERRKGVVLGEKRKAREEVK